MKPSDVELSRLAVAWGWIDHARSVRCLREADRCQAMGLDKGIEEILLEEGHLTGKQIRKLRHFLGWSLERSRVGGFEILRRIGFGGSGSVFEARHVRLNQRVALKVLYPRYAKNSKMTSLFLREAHALARLNHPHLVHAFDAGRDGNYYYLAMEYVEGENLLQYLTRHGPLETKYALRIVKAVCGALGALEVRRLVHRDIKPANILLTAEGGVKLTDLGLLKVETKGDTPAEEWVCGTPHYLAPEQARGDGKEDTRSDLYSLGATWYHALAGRPPFVGGSSREIILAHSSRVPHSLQRFRDDVSPATERTVLTWLAKDPESRPQTSTEALDQLARLERPAIVQALRLSSSGRVVLTVAAFLLAGAFVIWLGVSASAPDSRNGQREARGVAVATPPDVREDEAKGRGFDDRSLSESPERDDRPASVVRSTRRPLPATTMHPNLQAGDNTLSPGEAVSALPLPRPWSSMAGTLERLASRSRRWLGQGWPELEDFLAEERARFAAVRPLLGGFHAQGAALAPAGESGVSILLDYEFNTRSELHDFRARPGSVRVENGGVYPAGELGAITLESVYWLTPPLRVEGEVDPGTVLTLGFGDMRIVPRGQDEPVVWRAAPPGLPRRRSALGSESRYAFDLRLTRESVSLRTDASLHARATSVPVRGRVLVRVESGGLRRLRIEAGLEMKWARERLRFLENRSPRDR